MHTRPSRLLKNGRFMMAMSVIGLLLIVLGVDNAAAHPDGPAHHNPLPTHATDVMRAFRADDHAVQDLAAMAVTNCSGGFAGIYPCDNVDLLAFLPLKEIGGTRSNSAANDIWGWTDPQTGKEYALVGRVFGTSFVDISNPSNPVYLGDLPTHGAFGSSWRDIKTYANHAFIVSEASQHGMQVFDLTQLRSVSSPPVTFSETAHYNKNASAHNLVINEDSGYAYIVGAAGKNSCSGGLHMVNIQNPTSPTFAGCFSGDGYTHDAQCVVYSGPDSQHEGREICFNSNEDTVTIVDVTNKKNPVQLSRKDYPGAQYTHQGWLTEDQRYFLLDDELDEYYGGHNTRTRIWDVSDLDNPQLIGSYDSASTAIDHNQYVKGHYAYQANYRSGLRILDVSSVGSATLNQVGFFDIYPADDAAEFNGAWSNFPYFASGTVIVSGIEQGLFILRPNLPGGPSDAPPSVSVTAPANGATVSGPESITADAGDDNGVTQVEFFVGGSSVGADTNGADGYSVDWYSTEIADGLVEIMATATDTIGQTSSSTISVTVDNVVDPTMHIGALSGSSASAGRGGKWDASATITIVTADGTGLSEATVFGTWSTGGSDSCQTGGSDTCSITNGNVNRNTKQVTFRVTAVTRSGYVYAPDDNQVEDSITITSP